MIVQDKVTIYDAYGRHAYTGTFMRTYVRLCGVLLLVGMERVTQ